MNLEPASWRHHDRGARFSFFLSSRAHPVTPEHPVWRQPLPTLRPGLDAVGPDAEKQPLCYRDYFQAARDFLVGHAWPSLETVSAQRVGTALRAVDIENVAVFLTKHGQYYHPARVEVTASGMRLNFVLNVAVSAEGLATIQEEAATLARLNQLFSGGFLPQVYAQGELVAERGQRVGMFLGEWFDGYREFHLSSQADFPAPRIGVWDSAASVETLTADETLELYRRMGFLLTTYYNLQTFEQIGSWHHAAGDFVIKREPGGMDVKLVTVRRYASMFHSRPPGDVVSLILDGLMLFLADMLIRMRLDRADGTGDMIWSDASAVDGSFLGFLEALAAKAPVPELPDTPAACFLAYLSRCTPEDVTQLARALMGRYAAGSAERDLLRRRLPSHAREVYEAIRNVVG